MERYKSGIILTNKNLIIVLILISNAMACKLPTLWNFAAGLISGDFFFFLRLCSSQKQNRRKFIVGQKKKELEILEQAHDKQTSKWLYHIIRSMYVCIFTALTDLIGHDSGM